MPWEVPRMRARYRAEEAAAQLYACRLTDLLRTFGADDDPCRSNAQNALGRPYSRAPIPGPKTQARGGRAASGLRRHAPGVLGRRGRPAQSGGFLGRSSAAMTWS